MWLFRTKEKQIDRLENQNDKSSGNVIEENALLSHLYNDKSLCISKDKNNPNLKQFFFFLLFSISHPNSNFHFFRLRVCDFKKLKCSIPENLPDLFPNLSFL